MLLMFMLESKQKFGSFGCVNGINVLMFSVLVSK